MTLLCCRSGTRAVTKRTIQMSDGIKSEYENKIFFENTFLAQIKKKYVREI